MSALSKNLVAEVEKLFLNLEKNAISKSKFTLFYGVNEKLKQQIADLTEQATGKKAIQPSITRLGPR